jgi:hypothetical protein
MDNTGPSAGSPLTIHHKSLRRKQINNREREANLKPSSYMDKYGDERKNILILETQWNRIPGCKR